MPSPKAKSEFADIREQKINIKRNLSGWLYKVEKSKTALRRF